MKVIGIVGGIGAGKTTVAANLMQLIPIEVIEADTIGHEVLLKGQAAYEPVLAAFGPSILDEQGEIVRKKLGAIVFSDPGKLQLLNEITHPIIQKEIERRIAWFKLAAPNHHILLEAALLIESGLIELVDTVIAVYADENIRVQRVMAREGIIDTAVRDRIKVQKQWESFEEAADFVVDNSISLDYTKQQLEEILKVL